MVISGFNPTLGLILTRAHVLRLGSKDGFQSYLRSDSDVPHVAEEALASYLSILP